MIPVRRKHSVYKLFMLEQLSLPDQFSVFSCHVRATGDSCKVPYAQCHCRDNSDSQSAGSDMEADPVAFLSTVRCATTVRNNFRQGEGSGDSKLRQVNKVHGVVITTREPPVIILLETGVSLKDPSYPTVETKGDLPVGFNGISNPCASTVSERAAKIIMAII